MTIDACSICKVEFGQWPYPRQINGICMDCHHEHGTTWGLLDLTFYTGEAE